MTHVQIMPHTSDLSRLAEQVADFPITGLGISQYAEHLGYNDGVTDFVNLFSKEVIFTSRTDFLEHCRLLKKLLVEELGSVPEQLRSP